MIDQIVVAIKIPTPMQSIKMAQRRNDKNPINDNPSVTANNTLEPKLK
jgi:hypothetical protein